MIRRTMNKTPSKADIGLQYGLKFFTQLINGGTKLLKHCTSLRPLGTHFVLARNSMQNVFYHLNSFKNNYVSSLSPDNT